MSHFSTIQAQFYNLHYLEKALNKLEIDYNRKEEICQTDKPQQDNTNLIVSQPNNHNIEFCWDGEQYKVITDVSYWTHDYSFEYFVQRITHQYASEVIVGQCRKAGYEPVKFIKNSDGSDTVTLQRWKSDEL